MLGWLHLIESNKLPPEEVKKAIGRIHNNARTQTKLIDDLLDVSRIVAGKLRLEARSVDPYAITRAAIDTVRAGAEAREEVRRVGEGGGPRGPPAAGDAGPPRAGRAARTLTRRGLHAAG